MRWTDPVALRKAIESYFDSLTSHVPALDYDTATGQPKTKFQRVFTSPPTISGLAVALDTDRQTLLRYCDAGESAWQAEPITNETKKQLSDAIRYAHARVEEYAHEALYTAKSAVGPVFSLKNNHPDWEDVSTVRNEHSLEQYDLSKLSDEELNLFVKLKEKALRGPDSEALPPPAALPTGLLVADAGRQVVEAKQAQQAKEEERLQAEDEN
jgi:hypothetical protein